MDEPPDLLYRLIVHELTHQFDYDIIPASLVRRGSPLWIHEGLADYMTGEWRPMDLMAVRDAAVADIIPKMSKLEGYSDVGGARMIYNLGHAIFEFIESKWGKDGLRAYLFALRKSVIGGGEDAYEEAFKITAEEFDQQFDKYLKDRFKPFRDKERPADYGRNLGPNPEKTPYRGVYTAEPSPSGDLLAIFTGNRRDGEGDIVLVSRKDGSVVRKLTAGFDKDKGFEYIVTPGGRWVTVPWLTWSATGDRLARLLTGRQEGRLRGAAERRRRHLPGRSGVAGNHQPDQGQLRGLGADVGARRPVDRLYRSHQRQREAVPPRPRLGSQDAVDLWHSRRWSGALPG